MQPALDDGADLYIDDSKGVQVKTAQPYDVMKSYLHKTFMFNLKLSPTTKDYGGSSNPQVKAHSLNGIDYVILWAIGDSFYIIPVDEVRGRVGMNFTADHDKRTQVKWNRWLPYRNNWDVLDGKLPDIKTDKHFKCNQCGYEWESYVDNPTRCPKCHCRWRIDRPRKIIDGKVALMTKEEISEMNKTECARVRWMKAKGISAEEVSTHKQITCRQCGYTWIPIVKNPTRCAKCHCKWDIESKVLVS